MKCGYQATLEEMIQGAEAIHFGFIELIKAYGFPSERRMGYYFQEGEVSDFPVLTILIHIYQRGNLLLNEHLPELVCDGALSKVEMAVLKDNRGFGNSTGIRDEMTIRMQGRKCK